MRIFALASAKMLRLTVACAAIFALATIPSIAQDDPPDQAGRVSYITGTVSIQTSGSDDWGQAYPNLPVGPGDRLFTDRDGQVEIQVGQSYLRIGPNTDITLVDDAPDVITFGLAQGSVHLRSFGFWQNQSLDIGTQNGDVRLTQAGEMRVDVMPDQGATIFTTFGNGVEVSGAGGFYQQMGNWQALQLAGTNPVYPQWLQLNGPDSLDQWSQQRDRQIINATSYRYVNPDVPGASELDANGDWTPDSDYGPMWFPRNVPADWQPYHNGHWINRDPWGWVWVEDESWGYAPFHYGRWVSYRGRWGWIPGPREQRPVWSPALVVFAGGISIGGGGVSAWFPLGPGEAYRPWYRCSPRYVDRVNISNIHEGRNVRVQTTYVNVVNITNVTNINYVNRRNATSAMRQDDFASGRSAQRRGVQVDARQLDRIQVVDRPAPVTQRSIITRPVARPVPVTGTRPTFIDRQGMQVTARPGAKPQAPPVRQIEQVRTAPGRTAVAPPSGVQYRNPGGNLSMPPNQPGQPVQRNNGRQPGQAPIAPGVQPNGRPVMPNNPQREGNPNQPQGQAPVAPGVQPNGRPVMPSNPQREGNPNQPGQTPVAPGVQPNGRPVQPSNPQREGYPNQQNGQQNNARPNTPPAAQPQQPPARPTPPANNRQDFGPTQPSRREAQPTPPSQPPAQNQPQSRPAPPPQNQPQSRPAPPPQSGAQDAPRVRQEFGPQQQNKNDRQAQPQDRGDKKNNDKNQNKNEKKEDKKPN